jgi:hypothetical protein
MAEELVPKKAEIDFDTGNTVVTDAQGNEIEKEKVSKKIKHFLKKAFDYSPIGMSYNMSRGIMDSSIRLLDRAINENELNKVEEIKFSDIISLIREGKDNFEELDMSFSATKVNGFNVVKLRDAVADPNVNIDLGKKGDLQLKIKVKYK